MTFQYRKLNFLLVDVSILSPVLNSSVDLPANWPPESLLLLNVCARITKIPSSSRSPLFLALAPPLLLSAHRTGFHLCDKR